MRIAMQALESLILVRFWQLRDVVDPHVPCAETCVMHYHLGSREPAVGARATRSQMHQVSIPE